MSTSAMLYHEDLKPGATFPLGERTLSKDEIIAFGRAFDPQPMHIDEEAAKHTLVGGLCASGWHTAAVMMRMTCDGILGRLASLGSPGVDEMRWKKPVRPNERYAARYTVLETRDLASRRDVGMSKITVELMDASNEIAASWISNQLTRRRTLLDVAAAPRTPSPPRAPLADIWSGADDVTGARIDGYFDERQVGETVSYPGYTFTREAIIDFARQFDPQPFHLDEDAAKASLFGALCASGWHTGSIFILRIVQARQQAHAHVPAGTKLPAYGPSPGFRDLRWIKPVFVGDTIEFRSRLARKIDLKSRPTRGLLENDVQGRNQKGEVVFALTSQILAERREPYRPPS